MSGFDVDACIAQLKKREMPSEAQIKTLCEKATAILGEEDNVQVVKAPVTICGDLHGAEPPPCRCISFLPRFPAPAALWLRRWPQRERHSGELHGRESRGEGSLRPFAAAPAAAAAAPPPTRR